LVKTAPEFTSSTVAPQATCSSASRMTVSKLPASSSAASFLRPVGLMRSPITQKGSSKPMMTVFVLDSRTVRVILQPFLRRGGGPEAPPFSVTQVALVLMPPSGKKCTCSIPKSGFAALCAASSVRNSVGS
jgi:hypothetical protein